MPSTAGPARGSREAKTGRPVGPALSEKTWSNCNPRAGYPARVSRIGAPGSRYSHPKSSVCRTMRTNKEPLGGLKRPGNASVAVSRLTATGREIPRIPRWVDEHWFFTRQTMLRRDPELRSHRGCRRIALKWGAVAESVTGCSGVVIKIVTRYMRIPPSLNGDRCWRRNDGGMLCGRGSLFLLVVSN